jgi:hypothetical protein
MTPKKNIVRRPAYALPDGKTITAWDGFSLKETAFIHWYTNPGTEAFMNSGRAAARAGYKGNTVVQGYLLKRKPRIAEIIDSLLISTGDQLLDIFWQVANVCGIRMFFNVADFYRKGKMTVTFRGKEKEIDIWEVVPLSELTWAQLMCIDGIDFKGPHGIPVYKLPNREKAFKLFMKCYEIINPEKNKAEQDIEATYEIIRERKETPPPVPVYQKAQLKAMAAFCNAARGKIPALPAPA